MLNVADFNLMCGLFRDNLDLLFTPALDDIDKEKLAVMRTEALALRIGDGNGHNSESKTSHNGKNIEYDLKERVEPVLPKGYDEQKAAPWLVESLTAKVKIDGKQLTNENDSAGVSRMYAVGEVNFADVSCEKGTDNDKDFIVQQFDLCNGNAFPLCTQNCIEERIKEYATGEPLKCKIIIRGTFDEAAKESYKAFVLRCYDDYNIKIKVIDI